MLVESMKYREVLKQSLIKLTTILTTEKFMSVFFIIGNFQDLSNKAPIKPAARSLCLASAKPNS